MAGQVGQVSQPLYTYIVRSPLTGVPIYVGKGVWDRCRKHRFQNSLVGAHIRGLASVGLKPSYERIPAKNEDEAFAMEQKLIEEIGRRDEWTGPLLNLRPGGRQVLHSPSSRAKMATRKSGTPLSDEHKKSISVTLTGRKQTSERRQKHSGIMKAWWASRKAIQGRN